MASIRDRFIQYLHPIARTLPIKRFFNAQKSTTIFPFYHTVSDVPLPHINQLYATKNVRQFRQDLEYLLANFKPLDIREFHRLEENDSIEQYFVLSFDDGLIECASIIAPILLEYGIPATFFINSAFIDNQDIFYRYKASLLINFLEANPEKIDLVFKKKNTNFNEIKNEILAIDYANMSQLDTWANQLEYSFSEEVEKKPIYLSKAEIQQLIDQGFTIGAHSIDHPLYSELSEEDQIRQTVDSLQTIQREFQLTERLFAFPFTDYGVKETTLNNINEEFPVDYFFGTSGFQPNIGKVIERTPMEFHRLNAQDIITSDILYGTLKAIVQ